MAGSKGDKRKDIRRDFPFVVEYTIRGDISREAFKGVIVDICESGLSVYLFRQLKRGEEITIMTKLPVPRKTASVRWIRRVDDEMFKAGMMFV